jgi:hypothetical protein
MSDTPQDDFFQVEFISEYRDSDPKIKAETKRIYLEVVKALDGLSYAIFLEKRLARHFEKTTKGINTFRIGIAIFCITMIIYVANHWLRVYEPPALETVLFFIMTGMVLGFGYIAKFLVYNSQDVELKQLNFTKTKIGDDVIKLRDYYGLERIIDIELQKIKETDVYSFYGQYIAPNDFAQPEVAAQIKSAILRSLQSNTFS